MQCGNNPHTELYKKVAGPREWNGRQFFLYADKEANLFRIAITLKAGEIEAKEEPSLGEGLSKQFRRFLENFTFSRSTFLVEQDKWHWDQSAQYWHYDILVREKAYNTNPQEAEKRKNNMKDVFNTAMDGMDASLIRSTAHRSSDKPFIGGR